LHLNANFRFVLLCFPILNFLCVVKQLNIVVLHNCWSVPSNRNAQLNFKCFMIFRWATQTQVSCSKKQQTVALTSPFNDSDIVLFGCGNGKWKFYGIRATKLNLRSVNLELFCSSELFCMMAKDKVVRIFLMWVLLRWLEVTRESYAMIAAETCCYCNTTFVIKSTLTT